MKKILVLGTTGMLGSMVYDYLSANSEFDVRGTVRNPKELSVQKKGKLYLFDAETGDIKSQIFSDFTPDYIINCIGVIKPHCKDNDPAGVVRAIQINALFPHLLASQTRDAGVRVIQIATDCVYSGTKGAYTEDALHDALDVYGKTKSLGEVSSPNFLNIRCSIIGPEPKTKQSLLEWFLSRTPTDTVTGFTHHLWNGVTTLQFAEVCEQIVSGKPELFDEMVKVSQVFHLVLNETVNKYELLNIFNRVFKKGLDIKAVDNVGLPVDRSISTIYGHFKKEQLFDMESAVRKLGQYMEVQGVSSH